MAGYNLVRALLAPLRKHELLTLYLRAYPGCDADMAAGLSREGLIGGLLDYSERPRPPRARRAGGSAHGWPGEAG